MDTETVRELAESAARAHRQAAADLVAARERRVVCQRLFDGDPSKARRESLRVATEDADRAERLDRSASESLEQAQIALAKVEREVKRAQLASLEEKIAALAKARDERVAALVAIERTAHDAIESVASLVADAIAAYEEALQLADELRDAVRFSHVTAKPTVADARLAALRAIAQARLDEGRDPVVAAWLADGRHTLDWRTRGATAAELEDAERWAARNREQAQAAQAFNAGALAAIASLNGQTTATETKA